MLLLRPPLPLSLHTYFRVTPKKISESSILEFLEFFLGNNFTLSDAEDNTSVPLNRGGLSDLLLLKTHLTIRQKS